MDWEEIGLWFIPCMIISLILFLLFTVITLEIDGKKWCDDNGFEGYGGFTDNNCYNNIIMGDGTVYREYSKGFVPD